jgi:hypothetical protein
LIFYCEYSSKRGPHLFNALREADRKQNIAIYPKCFYPEMYLLKGGYKNFYECGLYMHLCEPSSYRPMLSKAHSADLRQFAAKAKTWTCTATGLVTMECRRNRTVSRTTNGRATKRAILTCPAANIAKARASAASSTSSTNNAGIIYSRNSANLRV